MSVLKGKIILNGLSKLKYYTDSNVTFYIKIYMPKISTIKFLNLIDENNIQTLIHTC